MEKDSEKPEGKPKPKGNRFGLVTTLGICLLVSVISLVCYDRFYAQKVVAVDIKGYLAEQRDLFLAGKLTEDQLKANIDKLEKVTTSIPSNTIVLMGDAVVRNVKIIKP